MTLAPALPRRPGAVLGVAAAAALLVGCSTDNDKELAEEHFKFAAQEKWSEACVLETADFRDSGAKQCAKDRAADAPEALSGLSADGVETTAVTAAEGNEASEEGTWVLISFDGKSGTDYRAVQVIKTKVNDYVVTSEEEWRPDED